MKARRNWFIFSDAVDFIAANVIIVNIYYGKMSYQRIDEEYAYGITDMIGM